jgi:4-hydroxy-tetrahydrodipicolinate synthase
MASKLNEQTKGVYIISATPFTDDDAIDLDSTDRLVDFYIEKGVAGITILGMMGEAQKLSSAESESFLSHVMGRVADRVPVVVGVSNPGMENLVRLTNVAMECGAAGVMVAPAAGLNTEQKIYGYYARLFDALESGIPVCYQDYPQGTGVHISVDCFNRLVADFPQLVMLKHEDWPGLDKLTQVRRGSETGGVRRVSILVGNGGLYLPQELARGADGAMTGFAYPEMLVDVVKLYQSGDAARAQDLFDAYLPLIRYEQQPGIGLAIRKETLRRRGLLTSAKTRAPGPSLDAVFQAELDGLITRLDERLSILSLGENR